MLNSQVSAGIPINNNVYANNMAVTANSTLDLSNGVAFGFGTLTIGASAVNTLHVTGGPGIANFAATNFANPPVFDVQGSNVLNLGTLSGSSGFSEVGSGTLILAAGGFSGPALISNGSLLAIGQNYSAPGPASGPLGSQPVTLTNAALVLASAATAATTFDMVSGNTVTLAGSNDSIIAGSVLGGVANGAITLAGSGTVPIVAGQTLNLGDVNGYTLSIGLAFSNSGTISAGPGGVSLAASNLAYSGGTFSAASGGTLTLLSPASSGAYAPAATGTVILSSTYSGPLANLTPAVGGALLIADNVTAGTLNVAGGAYFAASPTSFGPAILQLNGGTLAATTALTGSNSIANGLIWGPTSGGTLNFGGNSNLALSAPLNLSSGTYNLNDPGTHGTLSGVISGSGLLNISGFPTLANLNTYSGGTTLNAATNPTITNNQAFGTGLITFNNGGFQASTPLTGASALANTWTIPAGAAAYFNGTNALQLTASTALAAGNESIHVTTTGLTVTLSGLISGSGALIRATDRANQTNGTVVINNPGNTFSGGFVLQSYGGNIDVQGASTVLSGGSIASGPLGTGSITLGSGNNGYINLLNSSPLAVTLANPLNIYDATGFQSVAGLTLSGPVALTGPGQGNTNNGIIDFYLGANSNIVFSGLISGGTRGVNLRQGTGSSAMTLSGSNTYTGTTSITMGTLVAGGNAPSGSPGVFGNAASAITIGDGNSANNPAALVTGGAYTIARPITVNATAGATTLGGIAGGTSTFSGAITLNRSVTLSAASGGSVWFTGNVSGTGGIAAASPPGGNVTLSPASANGYSGTTAVSSGQLTLDYTNLTVPGGGVVNSASPLTLSGGALAFNGDTVNAINQTFAATTVAGFGSAVNVNNGGQPVNVALGAITRSGGALDLPARHGRLYYHQFQ